MKLALPATALLLLSASTLAQSATTGQAHIAEAERLVRTALGEDCEMNGRTDIPLNLNEPESVSHFAYAITYRSTYQAAGEPDKQAELYQMFCGMGAYNLQHAFLLRDTETGQFRLVAFPLPKARYDYADEEMTKLKSPPAIQGYTATHILINATYDEAKKAISSHGLWRGIGDAWDSGDWTFSDMDFVLAGYEVDPTFDGAEGSAEPKSYVLFPAP